LIVENALGEQRFMNHPYVYGPPAFRFYAGYPLRIGKNVTLGALCVLDFRERKCESRYTEILEPLAKQVLCLLELRRHRRLLSDQRARPEERLVPRDEALERAIDFRPNWQMIGNSAVMCQLQQQVEQVARGDWTVFVEGETGSGKELVAQAIHQYSERRARRFIPVNCAGLTESILGSQLFGHVKGAFTGATGDQVGLFEAANGGTIFLDEIGDVSSQIQSALLRVLQEKEITRLGETQPRKVDVRIITATNQNLRQCVKNGRFRQDLYYRIRGARIRVPSLRDHREDIPLLVEGFLSEERVNVGRVVTGVSSEAIQLLKNYDWPGNVRELRGAVEYAISRCRTERIDVCDLPAECVEGRSLLSTAVNSSIDDERARVIVALRRAGGSKVKAAKLLGIARATLYRRLAELRIVPDDCGHW
jgi:transcriptional regulator with GAF, ATPase, and Fis domain